MTRQSRYRGALLGLAAGDALGTTLEFRSPGSFKPISDIVGGGPFSLKAGQWTDDTSMALCLAESLIERKGFDPVHQLETYCRWYHKGHLSSTGRCFDIGITTSSALAAFERHPQPYPGPTHESSAGNGSLMRLAPAPLFYARVLREAIDRAGESSRTTHGARECVDACRYFAALIVAALDGLSKEAILNNDFAVAADAWIEQPLTEKIAAIAAGSYKNNEPPFIQGTGYVVKSLEAALWAFHKSTCFRDGALPAVNLGDDADTTGAIYGQIAGAYYGEEGIPAEWRAKLAMRGLIESQADKLYEIAEAMGDKPCLQ